MTGRAKVFMCAGIGLCVAGAVGLIVSAVLDVGAVDQWASVAGSVAGLLGLALTLYALRGQPTAPDTSVTAEGKRSIAAGGSIGSAATGDGASAGPPPSIPASPSPPGAPVIASGDRSVAAGGGIGNVSTGDS
ncbi:hypothetical protein ACWGII_18690 [Streptomyces sp. NPDC054855]